jgi:hypothetical protein
MFKDALNMGPIRCPETSVNNYHATPRNIPEERGSHQRRGGSLKSMKIHHKRSEDTGNPSMLVTSGSIQSRSIYTGGQFMEIMTV